jgi:hypothetical protein
MVVAVKAEAEAVLFKYFGHGVGPLSRIHAVGDAIKAHVVKAGAEAIFDVADDVELRESHGFRLNDLAKAQQLAQENKQLILNRWHEHFGI